MSGWNGAPDVRILKSL
jgi:hypothetical protein